MRLLWLFLAACLGCWSCMAGGKAGATLPPDARNANEPFLRDDAVLHMHRDSAESNRSVPCGDVRKQPKSERCDFIRNNSACEMDGGFLNYLHLPYCLLSGYEILGLVIVFLWMAYIFLALSVVVDLILCPSLKMITTALRMDENVAGVTFLAFGNGAADIFSLILLVLRGNSDEDNDEDDITGAAGMGSILGGGMFVVCIAAGLIAFNYPLTDIMKWPFIRNILFYLASVLWLIGMLADSTIYLGEAIGFVCLYLVYVFVVWVGHRVSLRTRFAEGGDAEMPTERSPLLGSKPGHGKPSSSNDVFKPDIGHEHDGQEDGEASKVGRGLQARTRDAEALANGHLDLSVSESSLSQSNLGQSSNVPAEDASPASTISSSRTNSVSPPQSSEALMSLGFQRLYQALIPEELRLWREKSWYEVLLAVISFPVHILTVLTCPMVDPEKDNCGWNKYLLVITMMTFPSFAALVFDGFFQEIADEVILGPFLVGAGLIFALAVVLFTNTAMPPSWNVLFAAISFVMAIVWIYMMADEVVNIVVTFAVALDVTGALLGLLMIAVGNSVCDLIANFFVARRGKPLMGFAASYGSPLLNMLIGIGIASIAAITKEGKPYKLRFPLLLKVAGGFLCFALVLAMLLVVLQRWTAGKVLGVSLLLLYASYFASVLAIELSGVDSA